MITLIANSKGGVGKTTVATNLAVQFASKNKKVVLADLDHNKNSFKWGSYRKVAELDSSMPEIVVLDLSKEEKVYSTIKELAEQYDHVLIDAGGYDSAEFRECLIACDEVIVPLKPNQADIETTGETLEVIEEANAVREGLELDPLLPWVYFTHVNSNPRVKALEEAIDAFKIVKGLCRVIEGSASYQRQAYPSAYGAGLGVLELKVGASKAQNDMNELFTTVFGD